MFEIRWLKFKDWAADEMREKLQYRYKEIGFGFSDWTDWQDVPTEVEGE